MESDDDDLSFLSLVKQQSSSSHHHHHHPKATGNDTIFTIPSDDDDDEDDIATLRASQSLVGGGNEDDDTSMTMDKLHETQEVWSPLTAATTASPSLTTTTTTPHDAPSRPSRVRTTSGNHHHDDDCNDDGSQRLELSKVVERRRSRVDQPTSARPLSHRTKHTTNTSVLESTVTATMTAMTQETTTRVISSATTTTTIMGVDPIPPNSTTTTTAPSSTGTNNITEPTPSTQTATNTARPSHTGSSSAQKENVTESPNNRNQSDDQATTKRRKTTEKNPQPKPSSAATTSDTKTSTTTTTKSRPTAPTKKLTFQDQVLVLMLNALKPFTLKLLSEELKTSETSVNFVLLSLVDKGLVVTKDFAAGKNGRVKTLYWANQDHHVRTKKTKDHLRSEPASATERDAARTKMMEIQNEIATVRNQWQQVLLTPSNDDLTRLVTTHTAAYQECVRARDLVRERIAAAGGPRTKMTQLQPPRIHQYYRDEWIQRKRKCMDFVEQLADALEKKPREIIQLCDIDTDEMNQVVLPAKKYPM